MVLTRYKLWLLGGLTVVVCALLIYEAFFECDDLLNGESAVLAQVAQQNRRDEQEGSFLIPRKPFSEIENIKNTGDPKKTMEDILQSYKTKGEKFPVLTLPLDLEHKVWASMLLDSKGVDLVLVRRTDKEPQVQTIEMRADEYARAWGLDVQR